MNIKEGKQQIVNAMKAYFTKDEFGNYCIPIHQQRPLFLMGPPGVGKTAIMEQVAAELHVGLVSYSMTHHTRQSALGLPFIVRKNYGGKEYDVSEYTMSEIIASVYDMIEETGMTEGILFLDEINCVSETLAPAMLQFLQYKIFGKHRVPDGWIVVTAGNPPEYNKSVREFDIVTWDRLKRVDIEPDFEAWKEYAYQKGIHASVMTYLDIHKDHFYHIETTVDGKNFVTARGWSDLSDMITLYEKQGLPVDEKLIAQYIQNRKIAKEFAIYYDLFNKYRSDYQIDAILSGNADADVKKRAAAARFDERLSLLGLIIDALMSDFTEIYHEESVLGELLKDLKSVRVLMLQRPTADMRELLEQQIRVHHGIVEKGRKASALTAEMQRMHLKTAAVLEEMIDLLKANPTDSSTAAFALLKEDFDRRKALLKKTAEKTGKKLDHAFAFCEEVLSEGQEILILVTELTISVYSAHFISRYGSDGYFKYNKELLFFENRQKIISELELLDFDE